MNNRIEIIEYKDVYKDDCVRLLETTFPGSSNQKTFEWRFESKRKNKPIIICAKNDNNIISFNSWLPWEFVYEDNIYLGYQSGESATDIRYRRKGIFEKVLKKADNIFKENNINFIFGFPSSMSYGAFYKAGYFPVGLYNFYIKLLNPFRKEINPCAETTTDFNIIPLIDKNKITPVFNHEYMQWRYVQNPKTYKFVHYQENNNRALFVVRENKYYNKKYHWGMNELILIDCYFSSFNNLFVNNAVNYLTQIYSHKVTYIKTFFNPTSTRGMVLNKYFHLSLKSRYETLIVKPINSHLKYESFLNCYNWDILPHIKDSF